MPCQRSGRAALAPGAPAAAPSTCCATSGNWPLLSSQLRLNTRTCTRRFANKSEGRAAEGEQAGKPAVTQGLALQRSNASLTQSLGGLKVIVWTAQYVCLQVQSR